LLPKVLKKKCFRQTVKNFRAPSLARLLQRKRRVAAATELRSMGLWSYGTVAYDTTELPKPVAVPIYSSNGK